MKKILCFLLIFLSLKSFAQYPNGIQAIGNDSNVVDIKGALRARVINKVFTDTSTANLSHMDEYPGAQIFTTSDNQFWLRNSSATQWIPAGGAGISIINIITDSSISICNFNSCDTFITNVTAQLVTILNDSTLLVCDTLNVCDTLHIPRTQFAQTLFDTTNIYNEIQNVYNYFSDTSFTNQFFPRGDGVLLDTVIRITDSTLRFIYTDGTQKEDTFRIALTQENITNITNIINYIDSLRGNDTTFILSASNLQSGLKALYSTTDSLSGNDTLHLEFPHNNIAEDSVLTTDVDGDLKMKLVTSGTGGGIDSVGNPNGTDSLNDYTGGVPRLAYRDQRVWNVKDYGAVGDGVTDDTRAIQRTINAVYAAGGGKVYFPKGTYIIGDTLNVTLVSSGGIGYGKSNSQLYIPYNQTPFTGHPQVSIEFVGESSPDMFTSRLVDYNLNTSGVILKSTIQGTGYNVGSARYPSILGSAGGGWAFGSINDAQVSIRNINFRVRANVGAGTGPTMSAVDLEAMSTVGYIQDVLCDIDTALYYAVQPVAVTWGMYLPYVNNSAFNPINNVVVGGYKHGYVFSEHTTGNNLTATCCEYGFSTTSPSAPHAQYFGRLATYWCKYSIANGGIGFNAGSNYLSIAQLDIESDTVASSWTKPRYTIYDSLNLLKGDITYHNVDRGTGVLESNFTKLGGANANLQIRYIGQYPDTTTRFTGFATLSKVYKDSLALLAAIPAQFNPIAGTDMTITGSYPNMTFNSTAASGAGNWTQLGGSIYRATGRVGVGTSNPSSKFNVRSYGLGATYQDSLGTILENDSLALVGAQQYTGSLTFRGNGWATTGGGASMPVKFGIYGTPIQGVTTPTANLLFVSSINNAAPTTIATFTNIGGITIPDRMTAQTLTVNSTATFSGIINQNNGGTNTISGIITSSQASLAANPTDYIISTNTTNATSGVPVQNAGTINFTGKAWDGTATRTSNWRIGQRQISGASPITQNLVFYSQINAGGYNDSLTLSNKMKFTFPGTITAGGTTGNQTIDKPSGTVNIAAGGTAVTVTNALCTTSSIVLAVIRTNDATAQIKSVVPGAGSFVINIVASTGEVSIGFLVIN